MRKILFSICAALAVLGCDGLIAGDDGDLPAFKSYDIYGSCTDYYGGCSNNVLQEKCYGEFVLNGTCSDIYGSCIDYYNESCYEDISQNECENYIGGYFVRNGECDYYYPSSSSYYSSSSSSSRSIEKVYGASVTYQGETYQTVVIGTQTWFARNLNYAVEGSICYDNKSSYCNSYGRLYDWYAAISACPSGWHLPSWDEWNTLESYIESDNDCKSCDAKHLKATSGWYESGNYGNGLDSYGFSALPGGYTYSDYDFFGIGGYGGWWSTPNPGTSAGYSLFRDMDYGSDGTSGYTTRNTRLLSVRCLKDNDSNPYQSSSSSSSVTHQIVYGSSVTYQGETYQTVVIGTQTWFTKNLNYNVEGSKCYNNNTTNCDKYGRLYNWTTAMVLPSSCNSSSCSSQINAKHQGICPSGWHIPSDTEWSILINYVDGTGGGTRRDSPTAGTLLKATSAWNSYSGVPSSTDAYGFSALPGGLGDSDGIFLTVGYDGLWWSASESGDRGAYTRGMLYYGENAYWSNYYKMMLFSVRCVED